MTTAITARKIKHRFKERTVIDGVSFEVKEGHFHIIIGPNGSGKTTLMKIIAGVAKLQGGEITVFGKDLGSFTRRELARAVAYVPQDTPSDFPFTVMDVVLMGRSPHQDFLGISRGEDYSIVRKAMEFTEVDSLASRRLNELSGGERQRVFIARAISQEPKLLLLDEPTSALDLAHQVRVMDLMERLKIEKGVTVVMVSHDLNLGAMYGDTLLLLARGEIMSQGTPAEVLTFETLEEAYGCNLLVDENPLGKLPRVTLVPQKYKIY